MQTDPEISIIIPVYNVEMWIRRAVESLQNQTFQNFEIILVNDGSTDSSGDICDELAATDGRIHIIHQQNAGAATARNNGIKQARGEYLYFMDGDDWCEDGMLYEMHRLAAKHQLNLVVTGFYIDTYYDDDKFYQELRNAPDMVYIDAQSFREAACELFDAQLLYAPWNKLYRRQYLLDHGIEFPTTFWDDLPFNLDVIRDIDRVGCIDNHFYHFLRARAESENTRYRSDMYEKREEEHQWITDLFMYWHLDNDDIQEFLARRYAERLVGCIENITNKNCTLPSAEKRRQIAEMISTPQAKKALAKAQPRTTMMRLVLFPLKKGNVSMTMVQSSFISWVKRNSTNLFARLKANR